MTFQIIRDDTQAEIPWSRCTGLLYLYQRRQNAAPAFPAAEITDNGRSTYHLTVTMQE